MNPKRAKTLAATIWYVGGGLAAILICIPFFWMLSTSLKARGALMAIPIEWVPREPTFEAYTRIFTLFPFARAMTNPLAVAVGVTGLSILSAARAAFAFTKSPFRGRRALFGTYLTTMMMPFQVVVIPLYLIMRQAGLYDRLGGLMIPSIFNAFAIFMLCQTMRGIPDDYLDAASIDGAGNGLIFFRIILPMSGTTLATLAVITFMGAWNDYFWPLVMLADKQKATLPIALSKLNGQYAQDYGVLMAGSLLSILPILGLYLFAQPYFKAGLQVGGVKG